jgi:hypothetical protein
VAQHNSYTFTFDDKNGEWTKIDNSWLTNEEEE